MKYHFHWQNLNDEPGHERHGFWYGRSWLRLGDSRSSVRFEWHHGRLGLGASLRFDRIEQEVMVHVAGPGFSYYLSVDGVTQKLFGLLPMRWKREEHGGYEREIGVRVNDGAIWFSFWSDPMDWRSSDPKWMQFSLHLDDIFLGKRQYASRVIEERDIKIAMPEGSYDAKATREVATWIRPRWPWRPFSKYRVQVKVDIPTGIYIPGKGENSYDCGPDAVYGLSTEAKSIEEAIGNVVASVLRTRQQRNGSHEAVP